MDIKPYVYKGTKIDTGEFYIGYRETNRHPALQDLGVKYFTSSSMIGKNNFNQFDWEIIAEYTTGDEAYWEEQKLIKQNITNPLCLNGNYVDPDTKKKKFSVAGTKQPITSIKMQGNKNGQGRKNTPEFIEKMIGNKYALGYKCRKEELKSRAERMKGNKYGLGRVQSKEQSAAHSTKLKKPIVAGGITFESSRAAAVYYNTSPSTVCHKLDSDKFPYWYRLN